MPLLGDARRRLHAMRDTDETGFVLIYVLMIITIVTILVTSTLVIVSGNVVPAVRAAYGQAATQAAQGGLQAFVAYADGNCKDGNSTVAACTLPSNASGITPISLPDGGNGYTASYSWYAQKDPSNRYFRVRSIGTVSQGGISTSRTVVGDVIGGSSMNLLDYGLVTGFETQASAEVISRWQARTIAFDSDGINAADVPIKGTTVSWNGSSPGAAAGKVAVCDSTFDNRAALPPKGAPNPYVNWTESGTAGNNYTHYAPCQTSWGTQTKLLEPANPANGLGGYYSDDALLISNSYPGGTGPLFDQPVSSNWRYTSADAGVCGAVPGQNYVSFNLRCAGYPVEVGGTPTGKYPTVTWTQGPELPAGTPLINNGVTCAYAGPTRVLVNGDTATITSPQTNSAWVATNGGAYPSQCYTGVTGNGMAAQPVSLVSPVTIRIITSLNNGTIPKMTPAVAHGSSGWPQTQQRLGDTASSANSVFYMSSGTAPAPTTAYAVTAADGSPAYVPATGDNPSGKSDGAWVPGWTSFSTGTSCSTSTSAADLKFFNCYYNGNNNNSATYSASSYGALKTAIQTAVSANPSNYATSASLQTLVNSIVSKGNSADAANSAPANADNTSHKWLVSMSQGSASGCTQSGPTAGTPTTTAIPAPTSDPFFSSTAGSSVATPSTTVSCYTATVSAQVGTCNVALVLGVCVNLGNYVWGNGTALLGGGAKLAQFAVTFKVTSTTTTTTVTAAVSSFPSMSDVTQYQMGLSGTFGASGPGDMYIEGNASHTMAFVAADDAVITGNVGVTDATSAAVELVGQNNVRVYHPVKCRVTDATLIANTSPGWCPDDITGLYSSVPPSGFYPFQQYVNMRSDLANLTISSTAVFALGNYAYVNCSPLGSTKCIGEFTVDNYDRGAGLGQLTEIGTLGMIHHSAVGQEWEIPDTLGQTSRPSSGYQMAQQYLNLKSLIGGAKDVDNVLQTSFTTSSLWHILSVSSAGNS